MNNPCHAPVRGSDGKRCILDKGHKGPHCAQGYCCDGCGQYRRGTPWRNGPEGLGFCFVCCKEGERRYHVPEDQ